MIEMNKKMFEEYAASNQPVLVDFWAPWCVYCRRIGPAMEKIAQQFEGSLAVAKVNIDDELELARQERIEVIPTLVLYHKGEALGSIVAPQSKAAIEVFLQENLGK